MKLSFFSLLTLALLAFSFSSCEKGSVSEESEILEFGDENGDLRGDIGGLEGCFDLVYPVSYLMPDGSTETGNNEEEVETAMKSWYEANPDSEEKPALQYPVDILFKDRTTLTVNNEEEMRRAYENCDG